MTYNAGESLADDAEVVMNAAEALHEGDLEDTETFSDAAALIGLMLEEAEAAEERGEDVEQEAFDVLNTTHDGLVALGEGDTPDDLDEVTHHVKGLARAYTMRLLKAQIAQAMGA